MADKSRNQTFVYMYALAILMVIDDHCGTRINILSNVFPYNSFYVPLFVFISGYFFKRTSLKETICHKMKKLYFPYLIYAVIFYFITLLIDRIFGLRWTPEIDADIIRTLFFEKPITDLNGAAWFVVMLFWVSIIYAIVRSVVGQSAITDCCLCAIFMAFAIGGLVECRLGLNVVFGIRFFAKTCFYITFYHYGYMFKKYVEKRILKVKKSYVCLACICINFLSLIVVGYRINFYSSELMAEFNYIFLPFITSVSGILFWYEIMKSLSDKYGEIKMISFIARNTFVIMQVHLLFVNIPNFYCYMQARSGNSRYLDFPIQSFVGMPWVRYTERSTLLGFVISVIGSCLIALAIEKIKQKYYRK